MKKIYPSLGINIGIILTILLIRNYLPPVVPLFYGKPVGESQLVRSEFLIIPSLVSIIITLVNFALVRYLTKDEFLAKVFTYTSYFINLLIAITIFKIVFLVGFF